MWRRVAASVGHMSFHLSLPARTTAEYFADVAQQAGYINRLLNGTKQHGMWQVNVDSDTLSAYVASSTHTAGSPTSWSPVSRSGVFQFSQQFVQHS